MVHRAKPQGHLDVRLRRGERCGVTTKPPIEPMFEQRDWLPGGTRR